MWGTITRVFDTACRHHAERVAVIDGDRQVTYADLHRDVEGLAGALGSLNGGPGLRVGLLAPNSVEFITGLYGIWKGRGTLVQLPTLAPENDLAYMLTMAEATAIIYHESFDATVEKLRDVCPQLRHFVRIAPSRSTTPSGVVDFHEFLALGVAEGHATVNSEPDDLAFIAFTSGTTGQPKAVLQTQATYSHYAITAGMEIGDTRPGERFVHCAPLTHFSQQFLLPTMMRGGTNIMLPSMDLQGLVEAVRTHRATATALVPTLIYMLLDRDDLDLDAMSSLRTIIYAGSPMSPDRLRQAVATFGSVFIQAYGGSEPGFMTVLRKDEHAEALEHRPDRLSSAGRAFYHVELSIQDENGETVPPGEVGEICARQEGQMTGYLDGSLNAETMRDGWVRSGDLGWMDEDGYLFIVDRVKDMIVTGGFNVFPRQIEDVLSAHPNVVQCAVIGVPHEKWGEAVKAVVILRPDAQADPDELITLVKRAKGSVWAPKSVEFVSALPLNPAGKVDKKTLRASYWKGRSRSIN